MVRESEGLAMGRSRGLGAGGYNVRSGMLRTGANRAEQPLAGRGEGHRNRVGTGQAAGRWADPRTFGGEHATASIGQRLPDLDVATPNMEPVEKARQE